MPNAALPVVRTAYLRALAAILVADGALDPRELVKLYTVFAQFDAPQDVRLGGLDGMILDPAVPSDAPLPPELLDDATARAALARDALFLREDRPGPATHAAISRLLAKVALTPAQLDLLSRFVKLENELLRKLGAGQAWMAEETSARELAARAAAVGLPVAALYGAGVTGLSAVGITSGLATIGATTGLVVLGLNPMTAGIAGLVLAGIAVKKAADFALGNGPAAKVDALTAELEQLRALHVRAAVRLSADIATYGDWGDAARAEQRQALLPAMAAALKVLEGESPQD